MKYDIDSIITDSDSSEITEEKKQQLKNFKAQIIDYDKKENQILINLYDLCKEISNSGFYNGYWIKIVNAIDKSSTTGYSLLGNFINDGAVWYKIGMPIVFCDKGGSRKNQVFRYYLISIDENGNVQTHFILLTKDYAPRMWSKIEELISIAESKKSPKSKEKPLDIKDLESKSKEELIEIIKNLIAKEH